VTDTLELSLEDLDDPPEAPQSPIGAQIERELGELLVLLRKCGPAMVVHQCRCEDGDHVELFHQRHEAWTQVLAMLARFDESDDV
jgi:hypothetical protein